MSTGNGIPMEFDGKPYTPTPKNIVPNKFSDIAPDIITMDIEPPEYLVPALGIPRNSIVLWTATDGVGKTFMAEAMALAVSRGDVFLGMHCRQAPVLYLDLENPNFEVQTRIHKMTEVTANPHLRVWGTWCEQQPPQAGSDYLLEVAKRFRPLILIDPLRYFHGGDEMEAKSETPSCACINADLVGRPAQSRNHHGCPWRRARRTDVFSSFALQWGRDLGHDLERERNDRVLHGHYEYLHAVNVLYGACVGQFHRLRSS